MGVFLGVNPLLFYIGNIYGVSAVYTLLLKAPGWNLEMHEKQSSSWIEDQQWSNTQDYEQVCVRRWESDWE